MTTRMPITIKRVSNSSTANDRNNDHNDNHHHYNTIIIVISIPNVDDHKIRSFPNSIGSLFPERGIAVCVQAAPVACAASGATGQDGAACSSWVTLRQTAPAEAAPALEPAAASTPAAEPFAEPTALTAPAPEAAGVTTAAAHRCVQASRLSQTQDMPCWLDVGNMSFSVIRGPLRSCSVSISVRLCGHP